MDDMGKQIRLNLTLSPQMDEVLTRLAGATGQAKTVFVLESMRRSLPYWWGELRRLESGGKGYGSGGAGAEAGCGGLEELRVEKPAVAVGVASKGSAVALPGVSSAGLSRAERRRLARSERKVAKR